MRRAYPLAGFRRAPSRLFAGAIDRVDEHLVQARVFQCHHVLRFTFRSTCEGLGLELVLTRILEAEELRLAVVLVGQFHLFPAVAIGIEGRLHLDVALVAVEDHDLAGGELCRDIEAQFEISEVGTNARIDVGAEFRIALGIGLHAQHSLPVENRVVIAG